MKIHGRLAGSLCTALSPLSYCKRTRIGVSFPDKFTSFTWRIQDCMRTAFLVLNSPLYNIWASKRINSNKLKTNRYFSCGLRWFTFGLWWFLEGSTILWKEHFCDAFFHYSVVTKFIHTKTCWNCIKFSELNAHKACFFDLCRR